MEPPVSVAPPPAPPVTAKVNVVAFVTEIRKLPFPPVDDQPVDVMGVLGSKPCGAVVTTVVSVADVEVTDET